MVSKRTLQAELGKLVDALEISEANRGLLSERLAELEFAIEDRDWVELTGMTGTLGGRDLSRDELSDVVALARRFATANPLVDKGTTVRSEYVFGQGVQFVAADPDSIVPDIIDRLTGDLSNKRALFGHRAMLQLQRDLDTDGSVFVALFTDPTSGRVRVRRVPFEQVRRIVSDPLDKLTTWFYERHVPSSTPGAPATKVLHPDVAYYPTVRPTTHEGMRIDWTAPVVPIMNGTPLTNGFALPDIYSSLQWAKAYRSFLEDFATIVRSLSLFAWNVTTKAGKVKSTATKLGTKLGTAVDDGTSAETNPAPVPGAMWVGDEGQSLQPISGKSGATVDVESGKPLRLMAGMGLGLPDHILSGDADQGTLATARSLDRPTELTMGSLQQVCGEGLQLVCAWAVEAHVRANPSTGAVVSDGFGGRTVELTASAGDDPGCTVVFPPILEHNLTEVVAAIVSAATIDGVDVRPLLRMLYTVLNVDNVDDLMEELQARIDAGEFDQLAEGDGRAAMLDAVDRLQQAAEQLDLVS